MSPSLRLAAVVLLTACPAHPVIDQGDEGDGPESTSSAGTTSTSSPDVPTTGEPASTTGAPASTTGENTSTGATSTGTSTTGTTGDSTSTGETSTGETGTTGKEQGDCPDPNSHMEDGECFCDDGYDWCVPEDLRDLSCCLVPDTGTSESTG